MIVEFVDDENDRPLYEGLIYAASMFAVATFQTLVLQQYFKIVLVTGLRLRTSVLGIVYRKVGIINYKLKMDKIFKFCILYCSLTLITMYQKAVLPIHII